MKRYSSRAILSWLLGSAGLLIALSRTSELLVIAMVVGIAAITVGIAARRSIRKAPAPGLRGAGLAFTGGCLGFLAIAFCLMLFAGMYFNQLFREQQVVRRNGLQRLSFQAQNLFSDTALTNFTSNLPIVVLETSGQTIFKESQTVVRARFFETRGQRASLTAKPDYDGLGTVHLRGTTTLHWPKKSYTFHTVDSQTNQEKVALLGLPKEADWVLYAAFEDKSLIRDVLAYELANKMGGYAPRTRYFEMFLNESGQPLSMRDYAGVYVLIEKIKRGKDRVNIAKLDPTVRSEPDISGGYIVKRDHFEREGNRLHTDRGGPYFFVYPQAKDVTPEQKSWLTRYFKSFEAALYGDDFTDPVKGYAAYLDVDSFIDAHWLNELGKNIDGFRYSAFLTKDRNGKLRPQPPWDWNRSFGNANYYGGQATRGWYWKNLRSNEIAWYQRLREDPEFVQKCANRWLELRKNVFDPDRIHARIAELASQLNEAQERNFKRWPILGQQIGPNAFVGDSFQDEVHYLQDWIEKRIAWIDSQVSDLSHL